jgi:Zn-dependent metalloprotease
MSHVRNSIHCIIPPVVLERIARNGNDRQREWALETMSRDHSLRAARLQNAGQRTAAARRPDALSALAEAHPDRTIRDAQNTENVSGPIVRHEGQAPTDDLAVNEAYDGLGATFEYYSSVHARNSIDDEGLPLNAVVHFGESYDNAFWDGQRMVFGDGDGELFNRFTVSLDVIGHELTHGVTEDEAGLIYLGQPGALNESVSDVFGSLVKQYKLQQKADEADWLIGAELLGPAVNGEALRSMKAPGTAYDDAVLGKDPQPAHMNDYVVTIQDNGGVHINSGIPNHAFYTTAIALPGYAWERAGRIWYATIRDPLVRPTARFRTFARATVRTAQRLYGDASEEMQAVRAGWDKVGVTL